MILRSVLVDSSSAFSPVGSGSFTNSTKTSRSGVGLVGVRAYSGASHESGSLERVVTRNVSGVFSPLGSGSFTDSTKTSRGGLGALGRRAYIADVYWRARLLWLCAGLSNTVWTSPAAREWESRGQSDTYWESPAVEQWRSDGLSDTSWITLEWESRGESNTEWRSSSAVATEWQSDGESNTQWVMRPGGVGQDCISDDGEVPGSSGALQNYVF